MNHPVSLLPLLAVVLPVAGGLLALILARRRVGLAVVGASLLAVAAIALVLASRVLGGASPELTLIQLVPPFRIAFRVGPMGALFALTVAVLFVLAFAHAVGYLPDDRRQWRFYAFALTSLGCMLGVAYSANLLTLLVFYELFSLLTYPLIVHERTPAALAAGLKYIVYILIGGSLLLAGVVLVYHAGGTLTYLPGGILDAGLPRGLLLLTLACLVTGFGVKSALMPLHGWVPDAHPAAPAPFSAVLSGVMVAAGVFAMLRVLFEIFGPGLLLELGVLPWLAGLAGATVVLGAMLAVAEDDLKRRLAYSTISQMAYVLLAVSLVSETALAGALLHVTHHAFFKGGLFFCAGLIAAATGLRKVSELRGLGRRLPVTCVVLTVLALAMMGVPPLSGFVSKWTLGLGMVQAGGYFHLAILFGGTLLAALYLWPVIYTVWLQPERGKAAGDERRASRWMLAAVVGSGAVTVLLGVAAAAPGFPLALARLAAAMLTGAVAWN